MTKENIDKYFTANHKSILNYIENCFFKHNIFDEEPNYFLSELYIFILKRKDIIKDDEELKKFISNFIYMHTYWTNSEHRELGTVIKQAKKVEYIAHNDNRQDEFDIIDTMSDDLPIELAAVNELYRASLTSLEKQIVWDIYFTEGKSSARKFGDYIGKSRHVGSQYTRILRREMKEFYNEFMADRKNNNI